MPDIDRRTLFKAAGAGGLAIAMSSLLAGCATGAVSAVRSGKVNLQFWTHDPSYTKTFQTAITNKTIMSGSRYDYSLTAVQSDAGSVMSRTISQAVANGQTPDLVGMEISQFPRVMNSHIAENLLVDLDPLMKSQGTNLAKKSPYTSDGKLYGLESDNSISVQYYRADLFEKYGIDPEIETWDEWIDAGNELHAKAGMYLGMQSTGQAGIFNGFLQYLLQRGGSPFDKDGKLTLKSQETLDTLKFMRDSVKKNAFASLQDPYGSSCASALKGSKLIATAMPNWYNVYGLQTNAPDQKGRWRIRTLPKFSGGGHVASTIGGTAFGVVKDKSTTDAALELLRRVYLTPEGQLLRYQIGGYMPTLIDLYQDKSFTGIKDSYLGGQKIFDVYNDAAKDLPTLYQNAGVPVLSTAISGPLIGVLNGTVSPEQAIDQTVSTYTEQVRLS